MLKIFASKPFGLFRSAMPVIPRTLLSTSRVTDDQQKKPVKTTTVDNENSLKRFIMDKIRVSGPITVAEYMQICAGGSSVGYYSMKSGEIFGERGDFLTSPEFTQMLGELIGVWAVYEVFKMAHRDHWQLVELGPGNGTLISDILKVLARFRLADNVSVHLVETSERLMRKQASVLCKSETFETIDVELKARNSKTDLCKLVLPSKFGPVIHWYDDLAGVPAKFSVTLAHEFFDALPIHKFRKTKFGWREVFVNVDENRENLIFSLAPGVSLTQKAHFKEDYGKGLEDVEISPYSAAVLRNLTNRITENGGASLIIDYGHTGDKGDTLRAFSQHKLVEPLSNPGQIDLTADVNFAYLLDTLKDVCHYGPLNQADFLKNLGLDLRFEQLMKNAKNEEEKAYLSKCYNVLTSPSEMGKRFKVLALFPKVLQDYFVASPPAGFQKLQ